MIDWAEPLGITEQALGRSLLPEERTTTVALFEAIVRDYPYASVQGEAGRLLIAARDRDGAKRKQARRAAASVEESVHFYSEQCRGLYLTTGDERYLAEQATAAGVLEGAKWLAESITAVCKHDSLIKARIDSIRKDYAPDLPTHRTRAFGGTRSEENTTPRSVAGHFIVWWHCDLGLPIPQHGPRQPLTRIMRAVCGAGNIPVPSDHYFKKARRAVVDALATTRVKAP